MPAQRTPGRDVAAHYAGTNDMHMFDLLVGLVALAFEFALQEEYANEIPRRAVTHQFGERSCLAFITRLGEAP